VKVITPGTRDLSSQLCTSALAHEGVIEIPPEFDTVTSKFILDGCVDIFLID